MARKDNTSTVKIKELVSDSEFNAIYPLIEQLNPGLTRKQFSERLADMRDSGRYRAIGAYRGKKLVGVCGLWVFNRFWCGRFMEIDNLVVDQSQRNAGIGKLMTDWVERAAKHEKCNIVFAASYSHNHASHRFYFREKYIIKGFAFVKDIPP